MKSSAKKVELAPYDDLFSTEESRQDAKLEKIQEIPLSELHPFKGHPFKVKDDEAMMETADSVRQYGVLVPAIARPDPEGGYELVAGHRRHRASELAEKETMPVIVRDLDDDAATIVINQSHSYALRGFSLQNFQDAVPHNAFLHDEIFQKYVLLGFFKFRQKCFQLSFTRCKVMCFCICIYWKPRVFLQVMNLRVIFRQLFCCAFIANAGECIEWFCLLLCMEDTFCKAPFRGLCIRQKIHQSTKQREG